MDSLLFKPYAIELNKQIRMSKEDVCRTFTIGVYCMVLLPLSASCSHVKS